MTAAATATRDDTSSYVRTAFVFSALATFATLVSGRLSAGGARGETSHWVRESPHRLSGCATIDVPKATILVGLFVARFHCGMLPSPHETYPFHHESSGVVRTSAPRLFAHLDQHARLSSHMSRSSWMMAGGRMDIQTDDGRGQRLGSRISIAGSVLGIRLAVDEIVVERNPPSTKIWQTIGIPRLLVIGHYRMGFEITPVEDNSRLQVFIDYALPETVPWRWVGSALARYYARWCTKQMVDDAVASFDTDGGASENGHVDGQAA